MAGKKFALKPGHLLMMGAVFMGLMTLVVFNQLSRKPTNPTVVEAVSKTRTLVVARQSIPAGTLLGRGDLKAVEWPEEHYPEALVFESVQDLVGRTAKRDLLPGEPIYKAKLAGEASTGGLPVVIPKGMRAVTVSANVVSGVGGFIKPGDRVDVLATGEVDVSDKRVDVAHTVLQNVLVLAIDQEAKDPALEKTDALSESDKDGPAKRDSKDKKSTDAKVAKSVTFALKPDQVERIFLAEELGTLRLALRNEEDFALEPTRGATDYQLYRHGAIDELALAFGETPPGSSSVELIQGTERTQLSF